MFKASLETMTEVTYDLHGNLVKIDECIDKLSRISSTLREIPYLDEVSQRVSTENQKLEQAFRELYSLRELYIWHRSYIAVQIEKWQITAKMYRPRNVWRQ